MPSSNESVQIPAHKSTASKSISGEECLYRIRSYVSKRRIRLRDFFQDYDRLRHGTLSSFAFRQAIDKILPGSGIQQHMLDDLIARYTKNGAVHYQQFCLDVENTEVIKGLETTPSLDVLSLTNTFREEGKVNDDKVLSESEEKIYNRLIGMMATVVEQRGMLLKPFFLNFH